MKNNLNSITHELRLALRTFSPHRSFTVLVLVAFGIGIGSMTAVFSIVNVVLLRPLPVPDPDRLVTLALVRAGSMGSNLTRPQYEEVKERTQDFEGMSAYQKRTATWQEGSHNRQIMSETVAKKDLYPSQLSGGQQQLVAVARAVISKPALLLADEPTGNLHTDQGRKIMELFNRLNQEGATIVQVTHNENWAAYGNRIIRLRDGWMET